MKGLGWNDPEEAATAFPEKYVVAEVEIDGQAVSVHNAHLPTGVQRGVFKVHAFEAIGRRIDEDAGGPTILCGDFNAPILEDEQGPNETGRPKRDAPRKGWTELDRRWMAAELRTVSHPRLRDVLRDVRKPGEPFPVSYYTGGGKWKTKRGPHRYDYIFASEELMTDGCRYIPEWPEDGLSDHAAVEAELSLA